MQNTLMEGAAERGERRRRRPRVQRTARAGARRAAWRADCPRAGVGAQRGRRERHAREEVETLEQSAREADASSDDAGARLAKERFEKFGLGRMGWRRRRVGQGAARAAV